MRHFPVCEMGYAFGFIAILLALYVGAYYAMVDRREFGDACWVRYPMGQKWAKPLFAAMHEVDREIRPDSWRNENSVLEALDDLSPEALKEFDPHIKVHTVVTVPE
jgi:hypothetical protein